jgi:hypothetical protein
LIATPEIKEWVCRKGDVFLSWMFLHMEEIPGMKDKNSSV